MWICEEFWVWNTKEIKYIDIFVLIDLFLKNWDFPDSSSGKESTCNAGDLGLIPGLGWSPGEGKGYLLQYSGLENSMDCIVRGVAIINCNWRLITLQYCGGFCHMLTRISYGCTCVPSSRTPLPLPSPSHPSGLSRCTGFECPVSCIELGLVIYFTYGNIHVSMLFSQIIPPSPCPTESKSLFFLSVSLLLSCI